MPYLPDHRIIQLADDGMITPFQPKKVSRVHGPLDPVLSYGVGSYGYDLTLSGNEFRIIDDGPCPADAVMNVKNFDPNRFTVPLAPQEDMWGRFFILPPWTVGLGASRERIAMPSNVFGMVEGKSTYARAGMVVAVTPIEPGWEGHLTIEMANCTCLPMRVYIDEGIVQVRFYEGEPPEMDYVSGGNKYRHQPEAPVFPRV